MYKFKALFLTVLVVAASWTVFANKPRSVGGLYIKVSTTYVELISGTLDNLTTTATGSQVTISSGISNYSAYTLSGSSYVPVYATAAW